ncbi:MAG: MFS transporter [Tepidisphaerales bacterium]
MRHVVGTSSASVSAGGSSAPGGSGAARGSIAAAGGVGAGGAAVEAVPAGLWNAHGFAVFNALSWQIVLGPPVILFAKGLGASATVLGVITALTPLLVVLQIPAAYVLPRYGYRRLTLMGWGLRTLAVAGLAGVPLLGMTGVGAAVQLALVLGLLLVFNTLRGFASGAWMPWLTEIVPAVYRARFLARDNFFANVGSLMSLGVAAMLLVSSSEPRPWQYSLVFAFAAAMGVVSLVFLSRIPDVSTPERMRSSGHPLPWRHMLLWGPFLRIAAFVGAWVAVTGGLGTFTVAYLRAEAGYSDSDVLLLSGMTLLGALATVWMGGRLCEVWDSPRVLRVCVLGLLAAVAGWAAVAMKLLPASAAVVVGLNLLSGAAGVNFQVASQRLTMATFPLMGRNHFFALYSVITSLVLGASPIVWGVLLDLIGNRTLSLGGVVVGRYAALFVAAAGVLAVAAAMVSRLPQGPPHNPPHNPPHHPAHPPHTTAAPPGADAPAAAPASPAAGR